MMMFLWTPIISWITWIAYPGTKPKICLLVTWFIMLDLIGIRNSSTTSRKLFTLASTRLMQEEADSSTPATWPWDCTMWLTWVLLYPIDDVYTEMCLQKLGLAPERHKGFRTFDIEEKSRSNICSYVDLMLVHSRKPQEMIDIWSRLQSAHLKCWIMCKLHFT